MNQIKFIKGNVYFRCGYSHPELPVPEIEAYVFIGMKDNEYVFQETRKYFDNQILSSLTESEKSSYQSPGEPTELYLSESTTHIMKNIKELTNFVNSIPKQKNSKEIF